MLIYQKNSLGNIWYEIGYIFLESLPQFEDLPSYISGTITPQNQTYLQPFLWPVRKSSELNQIYSGSYNEHKLSLSWSLACVLSVIRKNVHFLSCSLSALSPNTGLDVNSSASCWRYSPIFIDVIYISAKRRTVTTILATASAPVQIWRFPERE
jgi:hypothetical protein